VISNSEYNLNSSRVLLGKRNQYAENQLFFRKAPEGSGQEGEKGREAEKEAGSQDFRPDIEAGGAGRTSEWDAGRIGIAGLGFHNFNSGSLFRSRLVTRSTWEFAQPCPSPENPGRITVSKCGRNPARAPTRTTPRIMNLLDIAELLGAKVSADSEFSAVKITGASSLADAEEGDIVFYDNPRYLRALRETKASAALVPLDFDEVVPAKVLRVAKPSVAFTSILEKLIPPAPPYAAGIHPSAVLGANVEIHPTASIQPQAVIEEGVKVGAGTVVGALSFIGRNSQIGENSFIHPNVVLRENSVLGSRVIIHSGTVIGADGFGYHFTQGKHEKVPQVGHVQIDDDVEIGANTTIDRARFGRTWIQAGTKIDNLVQIAHNVVVGPHCVIASQTGISGSSRLGRYVTLAGQVGVVGHVEIGDEVVVAAKSGVSKDTPPRQTLMGMFGIPMKEARELVAHYHRLPKTVAKLKAMEQELSALRRMVQAFTGQEASTEESQG
jgi:UDP-3-O-[3-hydroxymyristoyl] glucosamine N-acyltransferase